MTLNTVTLMWDLSDMIESGLTATLSITPTAQMSDTTDHMLIPAVIRQVTFTGTGQLAGIVANDNASVTPQGTGYLISVTASNGQVIVPQLQTQLNFANGAVQWLDQLAPVAQVTTAFQYLPLTGGTLTGPVVAPDVVTTAGPLTPFRAALANRAFATCNVVCIGDSITVGQGASVMDNRWVGRLRALLNSRFPIASQPAGGIGFIGCSGTGESSYTYPVVITGSPAKVNQGPRGGDGIASGAFQLNTTGQTIAFTVTGDSASVMWDQVGFGGTFSYQVDANAAVNVSTNGASSQDGMLTHFSLGTAGSHTVTLAWVSSNATVDGLVVYNGDFSSGIQVHDCGHYGWKTGDWTNSMSGRGVAGSQQAIAALKPAAVVIMLGVNDQTQSVTPAVFGANLQTIIADIKAQISGPIPSFVLAMGAPRGSQGTQTFPWSQYTAQAWAVAAADTSGPQGQSLVSVCDFTVGPKMPGPDTDAWSLWAGDHVHPDNNGHQLIADYLAGFLAGA